MGRVFLSVAHYEQKQGASFKDVTEWMESQRWNEVVGGLLTQKGIGILPVPLGKLGDKVKYINDNYLEGDIAIEIHFNGGVRHARGSETLYSPGSVKGKELADCLQSGFESKGLFQPNRGSKEGWYKMDRPNFKDYAEDVEGDEIIDYFLRKTKIVAAIPEPEFIHNYEEINDDRILGCVVIAEAIANYLQNN